MPEVIILVLVMFLLLSRFKRKARKVVKLSQHSKSSSDGSTKAYKRRAQDELTVKQHMHNFPLARVLWVVDGDTIIVTRGWDEIRIRLDSIDCPEDGQEWGNIAKYGLIKLVAKREIRIEEHGEDDHGRILATIYVWQEKRSEWLNVNEHMVTLGHAWVMRRFYDHLPKDRQIKLNRLENWAKSKKVGLWGTSDPLPPWKWRKEKI